MGKAPALDDANGAMPADVPSGKTFWGLKDSAWGPQTGTMPNVGAQSITPGVAAQTISQGYHDGTGSVAGDADLSAGNIVFGIQIFGVTGTAPLASGNATAANVLTGKTFSNTGGADTGTMPNIGAVTITPGAAAQAISVGYHNGSGSVAGDANLAAGNIRQGVSIFGVSGGVYGGCNCASGTLHGGRWCDNGNGTVTDLLGDTTNRNVGRCLVWMKNANCSANLATINKTGYLTWEHAQVWSSAVVSGVCGLTDGSSAYEWRLPTRAELDGLTNGTAPVSYDSPAPFSGVQTDYWSATTYTYAGTTSVAWFVGLNGGGVGANGKASSYYVWPVRGGQ